MSSASREKMKNALLEWVVPYLKKVGFKGTYPNYYRITDKETNLVTFQFSVFVDCFCVNIAKCPLDGLEQSNGEKLPPQKVTTHHCPKRLRLGAVENSTEHWFNYDPRRYELRHPGNSSITSIYKDTLLKYVTIAKDIISLLEKQAEPWWRESEAWWYNEKPFFNNLFMDIQRHVNHL